ncbi:MAG: SUMF1/EgtB/PvdO family nonheme iron enzyme [Armatimonadetes bacterium]|nr:SUMF1/EgtB/PvdO family nonheme iron enzyme [Armatimonadota bacterium]MDE2206750.1 SUMF1/EgtB/PvdO family nonheme iron enzyme [Armatimonadota bacterium]
MMTTTARKAALAAEMAATRLRTIQLMSFAPTAWWNLRVHDFYSPIGWHFGHIGMTEELWTVCRTGAQSPLDDGLAFLFANVPENPKEDRVRVPDPETTSRYLSATRDRSLEAMASAGFENNDRLLQNGYAWEFALRHEQQHQETIAELLHILTLHAGSPSESLRSLADPVSSRTGYVQHPAITFEMGSCNPLHYDNEGRRHAVRTDGFELAALAVTCGEWLAFMADGGYRRRELWGEAGRAWLESFGLAHPAYWREAPDGGWVSAGLQGYRELAADEPVFGICALEAEAYVRWAGARLPTEVEWEAAASGGCKTYPWGDEEPDGERADFALNGHSPSAVGAHPAGATAAGIQDLAGGVWEHTATIFAPYPGFEPYPYDGYSLEHFNGEHRVCRGGSFATAGPLLRCTFRNWYIPTYRQGFLGVRLAR